MCGAAAAAAAHGHVINGLAMARGKHSVKGVVLVVTGGPAARGFGFAVEGQIELMKLGSANEGAVRTTSSGTITGAGAPRAVGPSSASKARAPAKN